MPFQPINFTNAPLMGPQDLMEGFNAIYAPINAKRKAEADALAAQLLKLQLQNEPSKQEYEREHTQAKTKELLQKINLFSSILGDMNGQGQAGGNQGEQRNQPDVNNILGSDVRGELTRSMLGLSPQSPAQQQQMQIATNRANTDYQTQTTLQNPTSTTLNRQQRLTQMAVPMLKSYIKLSEDAHKNMTGAKTGTGIFAKDRINAAEPTQILKNFSQGTEGYEQAKLLLTPSLGESPGEYQSRLYETVNELLPQIEESYRVSGQETPREVYDLLDELKPKAKKNKSNSEKISSSLEGKPSHVEMMKNGQIYDIPYNDVTEAFQMGYEIAPSNGGR